MGKTDLSFLLVRFLISEVAGSFCEWRANSQILTFACPPHPQIMVFGSIAPDYMNGNTIIIMCLNLGFHIGVMTKKKKKSKLQINIKLFAFWEISSQSNGKINLAKYILIG